MIATVLYFLSFPRIIQSGGPTNLPWSIHSSCSLRMLSSQPCPWCLPRLDATLRGEQSLKKCLLNEKAHDSINIWLMDWIYGESQRTARCVYAHMAWEYLNPTTWERHQIWVPWVQKCTQPKRANHSLVISTTQRNRAYLGKRGKAANGLSS